MKAWLPPPARASMPATSMTSPLALPTPWKAAGAVAVVDEVDLARGQLPKKKMSLPAPPIRVSTPLPPVDDIVAALAADDVVALVAVEDVVAAAAEDGVVAVAAEQRVVPGVAGHQVVVVVADAVERGVADQGQVLERGTVDEVQEARVDQCRAHGVDAADGVVDLRVDLVAGRVDDIGVVAVVSAHGVGACAAVQGVVEVSRHVGEAAVALENVVPAAAVDAVVAIEAVDDVREGGGKARHARADQAGRNGVVVIGTVDDRHEFEPLLGVNARAI